MDHHHVMGIVIKDSVLKLKLICIINDDWSIRRSLHALLFLVINLNKSC